jgi:uncharacterized cupin superfamily protein
MCEVQVRRPEEQELAELGVRSWPTWGCEVSAFPWEYDQREICFFLEGRVKVWHEAQCVAELEPGDLAIFPQGFKCRWEVLERVRKHYRFEAAAE